MRYKCLALLICYPGQPCHTPCSDHVMVLEAGAIITTSMLRHNAPCIYCVGIGIDRACVQQGGRLKVLPSNDTTLTIEPLCSLLLTARYLR
jgi:hypothetical protein